MILSRWSIPVGTSLSSETIATLNAPFRQNPHWAQMIWTRDNDVVPIVPRGLVDQGKIRTGVRKAEHDLRPDVLRIMYTFAEDVQGNISLFFRVVISDGTSAPAKLRETNPAHKSEGIARRQG